MENGTPILLDVGERAYEGRTYRAIPIAAACAKEGSVDFDVAIPQGMRSGNIMLSVRSTTPIFDDRDAKTAHTPRERSYPQTGA